MMLPNAILIIITHLNRCVSCHRTEELKWRHDNYMITECSASTEVVEISQVFNTLINKVSNIAKHIHVSLIMP